MAETDKPQKQVKKKKKVVNFGLGSQDEGEETAPETPAPAPAPAGGDFGSILQLLAAKMRQPEETPSQFLETQVRLANPEKFARDQYMANTYAAPFSGEPGAAFTGRMAADTMTPEQIMASQGQTAKNQWASMLPSISPKQQQALQGVPAAQRGGGEFDPDELRRLNDQFKANRTYM